jgi:2-polyprenyl-6-methoxyphenol hydroxylase-like FAD-dependent oxidoreductase
MRLACTGGGPAGLYFAILMKLQDRGHAVTVYERNPPGVTYGWGVVLWESTLAHLQATDPEFARMVGERLYHWRGGQVLAVAGAEPVCVQPGAFSIGRRALLELLAQRAIELGVEVVYEHEVTDAAELGDVDLVIASDGVGSRLRQAHAERFGSELQVGRNSYAWLGTTKVFDGFQFGFSQTPAGWIWTHAYGFDDSTSTVVVECTPETWTGLGLDHLGTDESLALLQSIFAHQLEGHPLSTGGDPLRWMRFRTLNNRTWHDGRTVLVGDAAHTTHYSIGSGTSIAIDDAIALAEALGAGGDLSAALQAYTTRRQAEIVGAQAQAMRSAHFFETIERYTHLCPPDLMSVLLRRHSPLVHQLPPALYCRLQSAGADAPVMRWARGLAGRTADALLSR